VLEGNNGTGQTQWARAGLRSRAAGSRASADPRARPPPLQSSDDSSRDRCPAVCATEIIYDGTDWCPLRTAGARRRTAALRAEARRASRRSRPNRLSVRKQTQRTKKEKKKDGDSQVSSLHTAGAPIGGATRLRPPPMGRFRQLFGPGDAGTVPGGDGVHSLQQELLPVPRHERSSLRRVRTPVLHARQSRCCKNRSIFSRKREL